MADGTGHFIQPRVDPCRGVGRRLATGLSVFHGADRRTDPLGQALQHLVDFRSAGLGPGGEGAYFIGHHGEAATLFTGARRFDGGVEGQQVGLTGNRANHPENLGDALSVLLHVFDFMGGAGHFIDQRNHAVGRLAHHHPRTVGVFVGALGERRGFSSVLRHAFGSRAHLGDGGDGLIGFRSVTQQDLAGMRRGTFQIVEARRHGAGSLGDFTDHVLQIGNKGIDRMTDGAEFVLGADGDASSQVGIAAGQQVDVGFQRFHARNQLTDGVDLQQH